VQPSRKPSARFRGSCDVISRSVWNRNETIVIGRIVNKCNCITVGIGKCLFDVCQIVFGLKRKDGSSLFAFNPASVYGSKEATAKGEGL
jgi:hypothetical protein